MKMIRKILLCAGTGLLLSTGSLQSVPGGIFHMYTAYGAESSIIETMSIKFNTTFGDPEEIPQPQITISGSGVSIGDIYYKTEYENWKPGKKVRMEITVDAAQGKYFPVSLGRSKCRVTGADFVSAKALDNTTMQVKVNYTPVTVLGDTALAGWSSHDSEKAVWKKVDYAPGYTLTLYGNDKVVKRMTVTDNSVSLKEYMTDPDKIYYYQVKAVPVTAEQKKYLKEGEFITSKEQDVDDSEEEEKEKKHAATSQSSSTGPGVAGSLKGDNFVMPDGTLAVNTWKLVGGIWYYFNAEGNRTRGWFQYGGKWYYFDGNGYMKTGWVNTGNGKWYYLNPDGDMKTGWVNTGNGKWYYLNPDGDMKTGWLYDKNIWYYLNNDRLCEPAHTEPDGSGPGSCLAPITGDGGKLAAQAADQTQKTTPVQEFQGILKNGLNAIKEDMDSIFEEASALYQIPSKLLRAVAKAESGFNPKAVSKAGAMGVMQLMPGTARSLGVSDPYNARQNILGGAKYLKQNLDRFGGDVSLALAAYNAGPGSVTKYGGIPPYKETQNYVKKIMADYTGNNTILAGRTVSTGTYGKTSGSTAVSSLIGSGLTGSSLTAGSLLGSFTGNAGLSGAGSLGTLLAAGKGENLSGEDWSNMVQILRLQMMMNMGKDTGTLI